MKLAMQLDEFIDILWLPPKLKYLLLFDNPFVHSSVMFRKAAWLDCGGYPENREVFEDLCTLVARG